MNIVLIPPELISEMSKHDLWTHWINARHEMHKSICETLEDDDYVEPSIEMMQSVEDLFLIMENESVLPPYVGYTNVGCSIMVEWVLDDVSRATAFIYEPYHIILVLMKDGSEPCKLSWSWTCFRDAMDKVLEKNRELYVRLAE